MVEARRLPWEPHHEGGFVAYPEGREHPARLARLTPLVTGATGTFSWGLRYDGATRQGTSSTKQAASDMANEQWPLIVAQAAKLAERAAWEQEHLDLIEKVAEGEAPVTIFAMEAARQENLMWVMDRIRNRYRSPGIAALVDALSRELYKFRIGQRK